MFERFTEKARRVIFFARYEAAQHGSPEIESEHLLLGLLREDKSFSNRFFHSHSVVEAIREQIETLTPKREKISTSIDTPLSDELKRILPYASDESRLLKNKEIGTEHLYLGILREENCTAAKILRGRGLDLESLRSDLAAKEPASERKAEASEGAVGLAMDYFRTAIKTRSESLKQDAETTASSPASSPGFALVELSPTELQLTNHHDSPIPRIGDRLTIEEKSLPPRHYRVQDVVWSLERWRGLDQLKKIILKVTAEES